MSSNKIWPSLLWDKATRNESSPASQGSPFHMSMQHKDKIILLARYQKSKLKNSKMFFLTLLAGVLIGLALWNYFIERVERFDVQIPQSNNISYSESEPLAMTTSQIADELEKSDGKPILLYLYTTWCGVCNENFPTLNEIAREFQNTELQVLALAIDRNIDASFLRQHFAKSGDVYFRFRYLSFKDGFRELLAKKDIRYQGRIPFTVLFSRDGEVVTKFTGKRSKNSLRNKIIRELYE